MLCACCTAPEEKNEPDLVQPTKVLETRTKPIPPEEVEVSVKGSGQKGKEVEPKFLEPEEAPAAPALPKKEEAKAVEKGPFSVKLNVSASEHKQLGLELDDMSDEGLMVINFGRGFIEEFNKSKPELAIKKYDRITAVNGEGGGSAALTEKLQSLQTLLSAGKDLELSLVRPTRFEVSLKREEKSRLGAKLSFKASSTGIAIEDISPEGTFADFNVKNPENKLLSGDHIIAVNGQEPKGRDMVELIKTETQLTLAMLRY